MSSMAREPLHLARLRRVLAGELGGIDPRLAIACGLVAIFPPYRASRLRALALRLAGCQVGHGVMLWGMPTLLGRGRVAERLTLGRSVMINVGCVFELGAAISIGDNVAFGPQVMLLTTSHQIGDAGMRAAAPTVAPITIGNGAWLGARCTVLPGVTIGDGAVIGAGALVNRDVAPNSLVAGVPAREVRELL